MKNDISEHYGEIQCQYLKDTETIFDRGEKGEIGSMHAPIGYFVLDLLTTPNDILNNLNNLNDEELIELCPLFKFTVIRESLRKLSKQFIYVIKLFQQFLFMCEEHPEYMTAQHFEMYLFANSYVLPPHTRTVENIEKIVKEMKKEGRSADEIIKYCLSKAESYHSREVTAYECEFKMIDGNEEINFPIRYIIIASLYHSFTLGKKIKRCSCCGKWFVPQQNREKYCQRKFMNDKSCIDYSGSKRELNRRESSEIQRKLHSISNKFSNCGRFDERDNFMEKYSEQKKRRFAGEITDYELLDWLNQNGMIRQKKDGVNNGNS